MPSSLEPVRWARALAGLFAALILLGIVQLNLPLVELVRRAQTSDVFAAALRYKLWLALIAALIAMSLAVLLLRRRSYGWLFAAAGLVLALMMSLGIYRFQQSYPNADLFDIARYRGGTSLLLGKDALLSAYDPSPALVLERRPVLRAAYPAIDVHFHLESLPSAVTPQRLVQAMDAAGIAQLVNLGGLRGDFERLAKRFAEPYPERFILFVKPDPNVLLKGDDITTELDWIEQAVRMGARGIKLNKSFGLGQRDRSGALVPVDDPRWDPLWKLAGALGLPVLMHTGEPTAFFAPIDVRNERYEELLANPQWSVRAIADAPTQRLLMAQRERLLARHPQTIFIGAHLGMNPENLPYAAALLDRYPNYFVDMSSVVSELGREPYSARRFFLRYQDRILFGTDGGYGLLPDRNWTPERMYRSYVEFLETENEYIDYPLRDITRQGRWRVYGIHLPPEVLEKIYAGNARRLIPDSATLRERLDRLTKR